MSYEIIKGLKLDRKNKKIFVRSSSNNVYPKLFERTEFMPKCKNFEEKQLAFFHGMLGGSYNLRICDNTNWRYAEIKFYEYCRRNEIDTSKLWEQYYEDKNYNYLKKYYDIFMDYVNEKHEGKYYLDSNIGNIINITAKGFLYSKNIPDDKKRIYDYKKAYIKRNNLSKKTIKDYEISIRRFSRIKQYDEEDLVL